LAGCAAITNPTVDGLPVRRVPPELLAHPKNEELTIPLNLLGQPPSKIYALAPGDVLGVYIEGVLGERNALPPVVNVSPSLNIGPQPRRLPPAFGFPITVHEDGYITLPLIEPIRVEGMTLEQTENAIRKAYTQPKEILPAGKERVLVTLLYPRQYHVVVMRQESGSVTLQAQGGLGGAKRNVGFIIDLPAYENDVLHALALTGGLPGLDAFNQVVIIRGCFRAPEDRTLVMEKIKSLPPKASPAAVAQCFGCQVTAIPLRVPPGVDPPVKLEDVVLQTGDLVFVEARDQDLYYTGGLLPGGEFTLPRDYDLDVIDAIAQVKGPLVNGAFSNNSLVGNLIQSGIGGPSPSLLVVLRRTPGGGRIPIRVDLNRALRDPRERLIVKAGDELILQEQPSEALSRYVTQTFLNFTVAWQVIHDRFATGVLNVAAPDRTVSTGITTNTQGAIGR
jgi:protein involved in polysaccharide export with SLBB domain